MQSYASCGDLPLAATNHDTLKPQTCLKMFMFAFSNAEGAREFESPPNPVTSIWNITSFGRIVVKKYTFENGMNKRQFLIFTILEN